jgi:hypothetical protein
MDITAPSTVPALHVGIPDGWRLASLGYTTPGLDIDDGVSGTLLFLVRDDLDPETAFHQATTAAKTDEYLVDLAEEYGYGLNIADIVQEWPEAAWAVHGIVPVTLPVVTESIPTVDHDEVLVAA